jgi:hypothetical protein
MENGCEAATRVEESVTVTLPVSFPACAGETFQLQLNDPCASAFV